MNRRIVAVAAMSLAAAGCATMGGQMREPEFVGRTVTVQTQSGQTSNLHFRRDGTVEARFGERRTEGRWELGGGRLCFTWARDFRECWPHTEPFRVGRTETIRSDRGNVVRVTMR